MIGAPQVALHFTPERIMEVVQRTKATGNGLPPTLINMMANHPKIGSYDLRSLRMIMYGGSPTWQASGRPLIAPLSSSPESKQPAVRPTVGSWLSTTYSGMKSRDIEPSP